MNDATDIDAIRAEKIQIIKAFFDYKKSVEGTPHEDTVSTHSFVAGWNAAKAAFSAATKK